MVPLKKSRTICPGTAKGETVCNRDIEGGRRIKFVEKSFILKCWNDKKVSERLNDFQQETGRFFITREGNVKRSTHFSFSTCALTWKKKQFSVCSPSANWMNPHVFFLHWNPSNKNLFIPDWIHQPHPKQHPERPAPGGKGKRHLCLEAGQVPRVRQHQWPQCGSPRPQEAASEHTGGAPQLWQVCGR